MKKIGAVTYSEKFQKVKQLFFMLKKSGKIRVSEQEEIEGLDAHEHRTSAYAQLKY
jgi:ammonia channel protein AmtB